MNCDFLVGDCKEILSIQQLPTRIAIVTDPPYGSNNNCNYKRFGGTAGRNNFPKIIGDDKPFDPQFFLERFPRSRMIFWGYNNFSNKLPQGSLLIWIKKRYAKMGLMMSDAEVAWMNKGIGCYVFMHEWDGWKKQSEMSIKRTHPTEKPAELFKWCISRAKIEKGTTIIDPYMGSGKSCIAAMELGYDYIGIDIVEEYVTAAINKFQLLYGVKR